MRSFFRVAVRLAVLLVARVPAAEEAPSVFVVRPQLVNVAEAARGSIEDALAQAVGQEGLQVLSQNDVGEILLQQQQLQLLGGDSDELSLASLGTAVGARHLLAASVTRLGEDTRLFVRLIDVKTSKVVARREVLASTFEGDLLSAVKAGARLALAPVFADRKGRVALKVSEEGADVSLDGDTIGTTPMLPFDLTGGTHLLAVAKAGFVRHQQTVRVEAQQTLELDLVLRPSADFLRDWRATNGRLRLWAWIGTIAAVVAGAGAGWSWVNLRDANAEITAVKGERDALGDGATQAQVDALEARRQVATTDARNFQIATISLGAVAGLAAVAGGLSWTFGEDPDRYAAFEAR